MGFCFVILILLWILIGFEGYGGMIVFSKDWFLEWVVYCVLDEVWLKVVWIVCEFDWVFDGDLLMWEVVSWVVVELCFLMC